jgi:Ca2+-binding RTX toxin-like protein
MTGGSGNNVVPADDFDANKAVAVEYRSVTLNSSGQGSFTFTVPASDPVFISAAVDSATAGPGRVSPALIVALSDSPPPTDTTPPSASGGASDLTTTAASHTATITWSDSGSGVDASTIGTNDITVSGGPSAVTVSSVSTTAGANGAIIATYTLTSAGGFTSADNGTYTISRVAGAVEDIANNGITAGTQDTFAVNIGSTPPPTGTIAVNSGGSAYTDADTGIAYAADTGQYANGGSTFGNANAIAGTNDDSLYNNQRYSSSNLVYNVPVANGSYDVTLKFAEIYSGITGAGQRIFDVEAENVLVLDNLDVYQQVGFNTAFDWTGTVSVTDGSLTLEFLKGAVQNPFISAISIKPAGSNPPPTDTTPPTASGGASDLTTTAATHTATITWNDSGSGVDASTIGTNDITVSGGPSAVTVSSVSTTAGSNGSIIATYTLTSANGFDASDNGTYTISRVAGAVEDLANNGITAGTQDTFAVTIGTGGGNTITGTSGNDNLQGTAGNDIMEGLAGNDTLNGLGGADTMRGGTGSDNYFVENSGDIVEELLNQGTDQVNSYINYTLGANVENLWLRGSAIIVGTGNTLNNRMEGNDSANKIFGLEGNDTLIGRGGIDELTGGVGNDFFDYNLVSDSRNTTVDKIMDFVKGQDKIDLATIDANSALSGNQAFSFIGTSNFNGTAGQVRYTSSGGTTTVFVNVNADTTADMTIQLVGTFALAGTDFVL